MALMIAPHALPASTRIGRRAVSRFALRGAPAAQADRFGLHHSLAAPLAIAAFEQATFGVAAHQASAGSDLARALAAEPKLIAGHALKGFANVILARQELAPTARQALADAMAALHAAGGGTADEAALVAGLEQAVEGRFHAAAARLEALLDRNPTALLPAKLAHALRFMVGDAQGMLAIGARLIDRWAPRTPGYGFLLGCHAFALEELGHFDAAERIGRRAVALEPADAWGLHAVSHVHDMQGRSREGIAWLEKSRPVWSACNNFSFHMAWHLALFHLEHGDHAQVLALYDEAVRPKPTDDFRDVANAVSLLWRLEQEGVAVGRRWDELRAIALNRKADTTLAFAALHNLLALVAVGEIGAAWDLVRAMRKTAEEAETDQAMVMDGVAVELATVIIDLTLNRAPPANFAAVANKLPLLGGSGAQRDVFVRTLAALASARGDAAALQRILAVRRRLKRDDRFVALVDSRFEQLPRMNRRRRA